MSTGISLITGAFELLKKSVMRFYAGLRFRFALSAFRVTKRFFPFGLLIITEENLRIFDRDTEWICWKVRSNSPFERKHGTFQVFDLSLFDL